MRWRRCVGLSAPLGGIVTDDELEKRLRRQRIVASSATLRARVLEAARQERRPPRSAGMWALVATLFLLIVVVEREGRRLTAGGPSGDMSVVDVGVLADAIALTRWRNASPTSEGDRGRHTRGPRIERCRMAP